MFRLPTELLEAYMSALHAAFLLAMCSAIAGVVSGMSTRNHRLRTTLDHKRTDAKYGCSNVEHEEDEEYVSTTAM